MSSLVVMKHTRTHTHIYTQTDIIIIEIIIKYNSNCRTCVPVEPVILTHVCASPIVVIKVISASTLGDSTNKVFIAMCDASNIKCTATGTDVYKRQPLTSL